MRIREELGRRALERWDLSNLIYLWISHENVKISIRLTPFRARAEQMPVPRMENQKWPGLGLKDNFHFIFQPSLAPIAQGIRTKSFA